MAQANKFGTFSGVFTPSILTILGVIMYLRLPWIVGQSGFWNTVAIIVVAHIISITTGLSVSSIATDKKVKAGGTYYMISRSLGLPIGGTLGLALFVGLSFSVSLYLIGFSESFLSYWGFEVSKANIRVAGTLALIAVTTVTFISTALALKSQFFILGAIILSLFSVLFGNHDLAPKGDSLIPISTVPWMVLFGIFFPAVTGFEAGVSMSGDLKDPKKSIPVGTIAAIVVGLVVYIGLAGFFSTSVNADSLVNNPNVLLEISLFAPLVIAGIWAATISSALGSILGAPRILQAAANDRIGPRVFAKGYGKENEPRNALLLTFLIAEAGILIGELNVIARVVSMFFITTYGFLNLSSALESWASTDFRPEFRIPKTISIIGSLACFLVMILLDFPAMVGATIVLGALFLYLTRKQLTLESGDTWEGVWSSVVRTGLQKLNRRETHLRNWRPNMLLFSGGEQARPHLVELGEWLVRARGMLTDFVLKENPALDSPLSRIRSREADGEIPVPGVFSKEMSCQNIYQGIDAVSQVYGFADINPNAILMGWGKNSRDPRQFATLIGHLQARDFNVLLLRYDKGRAFGKHARIDLWWRGGNNNATLSLNMLKFLSGSDEWREAQIRLLIVINDSATLNRVHTNMTRLLEEERLEATVKVINNAVEQRPFGEILVAESADADLTLLGLARVQESQLNDFVARTESTLSGLGTVLLSHASSYFKPMYVGIDEDAENVVETATAADWDAAAAALPPITLEGSAGDAESRQQLLRLLSEASTTLEGEIYRFYQQLELIQQNQARLGETLADLLERNLSALQKGPQADSPRRRKQLVRARSDFLFHTQQLIAEFEAHLEKDQQTVLSQALKELREGIVAIPRDLPAEVMLYLDEADINPAAGDSAAEKGFKARQRFRQKFFKTVPHKKVPLGFLLTKTLETRIFPVLEKQLGEMALESYRFATGLQKWVNRSRDVFGLIEKGLPGGGKVSETDSPDLGAEMNRLAANLENRSLSTAQALLSESRAAVQAAAEQAVLLENPRKSRRRMAYFRVPPATWINLDEAPESWTFNLSRVMAYSAMDVHLNALENRIAVIWQKFLESLQLDWQHRISQPLEVLEKELGDLRQKSDDPPGQWVTQAEIQQEIPDPRAVMRGLQADIGNAVQTLPESMEVYADASFQQVEEHPLESLETATISLQQLVNFMLQARLLEPVQKTLATLPQQLEDSMDVMREVVRLVSFNLSSDEEGEEESGADADKLSLTSIVESGIQRVAEERKRVDATFAETSRKLNAALSDGFEHLNAWLLLREAGNLGHYLRSEESKKVLSRFEVLRARLRDGLRQRFTRLLYRQSEGVLLARKLLGETQNPTLINDRFLQLVTALTPKPAVLNALPQFYRQLFLGKQAIGKSFWVGRERDLARAEDIIARHRRGYYGAMLILGERQSGKTALSRAVASRFAAREQVYHVFPPESGSIQPRTLKKVLRETLKGRGDTDALFENLPRNSVVVFHDLELWWERSPGGEVLLREIARIVNRFGDRHFLVINTLPESYRLMNSIFPLDDLFIGVVSCTPFDAEDLQTAILLRHEAAGLQFELDGETEEDLSGLKMARYFNRIFEYSAGNVGVALQAWIAHIERVAPGKIVLKAPQNPDLDFANRMDPQWQVWLYQFHLHKHLTRERLQRIFRSNEEEVRRMMNVLARAGAIVPTQGDVWEMNPFLQPFLAPLLRKENHHD